MLTPREIALKTIESGVKKGKLSIFEKFSLSIFAGMFIGFGAYGSLTVMQSLGNLDLGLMKFLGAVVFPVGLMFVIIAGGELFTGNNLMTMALLDKKITFKEMLSNWIIVYIGNLIGSVFLAFLISKTGLANENISELAVSTAIGKANLSISQALIRGFLCNILVVLAVWMATGAKDIGSKILAIWFPIMLFVLMGYEHSVANMFYIPLGNFLGANISWSKMWIGNLIPVTLGNILGGGIFIPFVYYIVYVYLDK